MENSRLAGSVHSAKGGSLAAGSSLDALAPTAGTGGQGNLSSKGDKPKIRSSKSKPKPGIYSVKEYILTEDTLENIGTLRTSVTFWSSVGSLALGFVLSTGQSLTLAADEADVATNAAWCAFFTVGLFVMIASYSAAIWYFCKGKSVLQFVKDHTTHEDD